MQEKLENYGWLLDPKISNACILYYSAFQEPQLKTIKAGMPHDQKKAGKGASRSSENNAFHWKAVLTKQLLQYG